MAEELPDPPKHRVRSIDLARALGVSRTAVSFVLSNSPNASKISEANQERIRRLARAWNYIPNHAATVLRRQRSGTVGVVFADLKHGWAERILQNMFPVLEAEECVALVSMSMWDEHRERAEIHSMLRRQVDAIAVVAPTIGNLDVYEEVIEGGTPLVFMGDSLAESDDFHRVLWDEAAAVNAAMDHLTSAGRQSICLVESDYPSLLQRERREAFRAATNRAGIEPSCSILENGRALPVEGSLTAFLARTESPPGAFLATNDALALDVLEYLDHAGIRVPQEIAVMGLGDLPTSSLPRVSLSTVRPPTERIGRETAALLVKLSEAPDDGPVHIHLPSTDVIVRDTTA